MSDRSWFVGVLCFGFFFSGAAIGAAIDGAVHTARDRPASAPATSVAPTDPTDVCGQLFSGTFSIHNGAAVWHDGQVELTCRPR